MNSTNNDRIYVHVLHKTATVGRYVFWWFFHQLALHYLYHSALQYYIGKLPVRSTIFNSFNLLLVSCCCVDTKVIVRRLDIWSAAGLGYTLGQFFMTKYLVLYGLPSALAKLDYIEAPPPPKCVGRIHLYSQMWRDFDRGLYNFMLKYLFIIFRSQSQFLIQLNFFHLVIFIYHLKEPPMRSHQNLQGQRSVLGLFAYGMELQVPWLVIEILSQPNRFIAES